MHIEVKPYNYLNIIRNIVHIPAILRINMRLFEKNRLKAHCFLYESQVVSLRPTVRDSTMIGVRRFEIDIIRLNNRFILLIALKS